MLMNEFFESHYDFILTSKFKSDSIKRNFHNISSSSWPLRGHKFRTDFIWQGIGKRGY